MGAQEESNNDLAYAELHVPDDLDVDPDDLDVEVVDSTPPADRGRSSNPDEFADVVIPTDEAEQYSAKVQQRINTLTAQAHTERRAREKLTREHEEAVILLQQMHQQNQSLDVERRQMRKQMATGERVFVDNVKESLAAKLESAEGRFRAAYDTGDTDALIKAQREIGTATAQLQMAANYQPSEEEPEAPTPVAQPRPQSQQRAPQQPVMQDPAFTAWHETNAAWFDQKDSAMHRTSMLLHRVLTTDKNINPVTDSEVYYSTIDREMRRRFPEYRWGEKAGGAPMTVAPVSAPQVRRKRSVTLTSSERSLAEKMGLTVEQYAAEKVKLEKRG